MEVLTLGETAVPLGGARFEQTLEGTLQGPRLRADRLTQLHLYAQVVTEDRTTISMSSVGVCIQVEGERYAQLMAAVALHTASETFGWLNRLRLWAVVTLDPIAGEAATGAYAT